MLTIAELARHYSVTTDTVRSWIASGLLPAINVAPHGSKRRHYRVSPDSLAAFEQVRSSGKPKPSKVAVSVKEWV